MPRTVRTSAVVDFGSLELTGDLVHDSAQNALWLETDEGPEHISTSLVAYGLVPEPGCVFVKDWSEHEGLADRMAAAGLVRVCRRLAITPPHGHALGATEVVVL